MHNALSQRNNVDIVSIALSWIGRCVILSSPQHALRALRRKDLTPMPEQFLGDDENSASTRLGSEFSRQQGEPRRSGGEAIVTSRDGGKARISSTTFALNGLPWTDWGR
ncbi:hypothetical protein M406DRAFT_356008 [Cryphonectria parasitica EP155]|uniref:Uncharacterized protein n=1 Tax=Cryphonectria parasitica (strain ATCC 38755 / EP155) TaxID=660469 RepID=A0A9P5CP02_CRYP1|nr:uncharacterized protein M406DRAFT_356008 [Cryphonectria parasitica EP155]KAF3765663.1 hypothetical protein M406DRAFT_356008 [Cryphonectria parasitica EP155]